MTRSLPSLGRLLALLFNLCALATAAQADPEGEALAQQVFERPQGAQLSSSLTMTLSDGQGALLERQMVLYRRRAADGAVQTLIRFTAPAEIRATGLLSLETAAGVVTQWVYLPALERVRRIDAGRRGGRFVDSDYYYEDLGERSPTDDRHRLLRREQINGVECLVLESVPRQRGHSVYRKRISWIDPESLLAVRIDLFEKGDEQPTKRWQLQRQEQIDGYWSIVDSRMTELASGHQTRLQAVGIHYDRPLPEALFSRHSLEDPQLERLLLP